MRSLIVFEYENQLNFNSIWMTQRVKLLLAHQEWLNEWMNYLIGTNYAFNNLIDQIFQTDDLACSPVWEMFLVNSHNHNHI